MRSSPWVLAALLAAAGQSAWSQVGDGPVAPITAPPGSYSSPPSAALRPVTPPVQRFQPVPSTGMAAAPVPTATVANRASTVESREERRFLRDAAAQSRFELDASRMAFEKTSSGDVRKLAAALINHHNTVGLELAHLLNARGMAAPMISNDQRKVLNQLAKLSGSRFDAVYMQQVGLAQANVARNYEKAADLLRGSQIHGWIAKTLATTRYHQDMAERSMTGTAQAGRWNRGVQPVAAAGGRAVSGSNTP